jgi:hypothetical protein
LQRLGEDVKQLALIAPLLGGCFFYTEEINQRPSLEIVNPSGTAVTRGQENVQLFAVTSDPDADFVELHWRMNVCADAADFSTCDEEPVLESSSNSISFTAPVLRANNDPAESLRVVLEGVDEYGAVARPTQQLNIPLGNGLPTITLTDESKYGFTKNTPVDVFAVYGDPDDGAAAVTLSFELESPALSNATLSDVCTADTCPVPSDSTKLQHGVRFTPDIEGSWVVRVTANDPIGAPDGQTTSSHTVVVSIDKFPCLGLVSPIAPEVPTTLPLSDPTLFQVHQVIDALDPFPTNLADPLLSQAQFRWSIDRQVQPTTGNSFAFDPAVFAPGQLVEVRVELADRTNPFPNAATCDDNSQICEHEVTVPACLQRQSWVVEVR